MTSALLVCLFTGRDEEACSVVADAVALLASIIGSVVTTAGRLAFKAASLGGPARAIYAANKARQAHLPE